MEPDRLSVDPRTVVANARWAPAPDRSPVDLSLLIVRPAWQAQAACRGKSDSWYQWFPERGTGSNDPDSAVAAALRVCQRCPVRLECLDWAIEHNEPGVWGGTLHRQRKRMRATRKRAS